MKFINESGLYDLILESKKPEAKVFRRWVTNEVLRSGQSSCIYLQARGIILVYSQSPF